MKKKITYIERNLIHSPYYIGLCTTEEAFKKELKRLKIKEDVSFINSGSNATTHFLESTDHRLAAIICLDNKKLDRITKYAMLVHEAVHVFQHICTEIGESKPSHEFEAYSIQNISLRLFCAYNKLAKKGNP